MKLKFIAVLVTLLALGCAGDDKSSKKKDGDGAKKPDVKSNESASKTDPAAEELTEVSFNVSGMK